jgi:hypothetical protein
MKSLKLAVVLVCVILVSCDKTENLPRGISITKTYYGGDADESSIGSLGLHIVKTEDGGSVITGQTWSKTGDFLNLNTQNGDIYVLKLNSLGEKEWVKTYGGSGFESGASIAATKDGGYILTGSSSSNDGDFLNLNKGASDIFVMKLTSYGEIEWIKNFGDSSGSFQWGQSIIQTKDGDYVVTGVTRYSDDGDFIGLTYGEGDIVVIKLNSSGEKLWATIFGGSEQERTYSITEIKDGSYVVTGTTYSNDGDFLNLNKGDQDAFCIKINSNGQKEWIKTLGGSSTDNSFSVTSSNDGGFVITGQKASDDGDYVISKGKPNTMVHITKFSSSGDIQWLNTYQGGVYGASALSIVQTQDGGFIAAGMAAAKSPDFRGPARSGQGILVFKINSTGRIEWVDTYETTSDYASSICQLNNGNYVVTGYSYQKQIYQSRILVLLYNINGLGY